MSYDNVCQLLWNWINLENVSFANIYPLCDENKWFAKRDFLLGIYQRIMYYN